MIGLAAGYVAYLSRSVASHNGAETVGDGVTIVMSRQDGLRGRLPNLTLRERLSRPVSVLAM